MLILGQNSLRGHIGDDVVHQGAQESLDLIQSESVLRLDILVLP